LDHTRSNPARPPTCSKAQKKKQKKNMARFLKDAEGGKKPLFDQAKMSFDEYLGQYYNLDFEDLVRLPPLFFPI
jgi:hypothetical protein